MFMHGPYNVKVKTYLIQMHTILLSIEHGESRERERIIHTRVFIHSSYINEDGMEWRVDMEKRKLCMRRKFWEREINVVEGFRYV